MDYCRRFLLLSSLVTGLVLGQPGSTLADGMNGPAKRASRPNSAGIDASGAASRPLTGAIRLFQEYISPTDGGRCQFAPTCSAFGHQAIRRHGPWLGVLMTADRLMRCGPLTDPGDYPQLPNGRLADPVVARPGSR